MFKTAIFGFGGMGMKVSQALLTRHLADSLVACDPDPVVRAGKAVFLEKPIAKTYAASRRLVEFAAGQCGFLQIGYELRYSNLYLWVKDAIHRGLPGRVVGVDCRYICSEFHGKGSWRNDPATGGSMFAEKLCHYIDLPRWWLADEVDRLPPALDTRDALSTMAALDATERAADSGRITRPPGAANSSKLSVKR